MGRQRLSMVAPALILVVIAVNLGACAPPAPQPVTPSAVAPMASAPPAPQPVTPSAVAPAPGLEEATWAKVVVAAQKEGTVTFYSASFAGDVGMAVARAFQDRYGIRMDILTGKGADWAEKIKVEQRIGQYVVDVNEGSSTSISRLKTDGFSIPLKGTGLPVLQEKDVWVIEPFGPFPEGYAVAHLYTPFEFWVNTKLVPASEEPHSFLDLLQPRWKGKMIIPDTTLNSSLYLNFVPLTNQKVLDWDYVKALGRQDLQVARTTPEMFLSLARGDAYLAPIGDSGQAGPALLEGAPIKPISPAEGAAAYAAGVAIIKNAPHPNAAKVLVNWIASQEGQIVFHKARGSPSVRRDVPDFRPPAASTTAKKLYMNSQADSDQVAKMMQERFIPNLWKQ